MTKHKIREILASGGLSLIFTPKRQPTEDWQALAGELAGLLQEAKGHVLARAGSDTQDGAPYPDERLSDDIVHALARYNDAVARHGGGAL
jgi:hypothetical protein